MNQAVLLQSHLSIAARRHFSLKDLFDLLRAVIPKPSCTLEPPREGFLNPHASRDFHTLRVRVQNGTTTSEKNVRQFLKKLNMSLLYDPAIPLPGVTPRKIKAYVYTKTCAQMSIAVLFVRTANWNYSKCPSTGEWMSELRYLYPVEYYSAINKNKLLRDTTWMNLQRIVLNERSRAKKKKKKRLYDSIYMKF